MDKSNKSFHLFDVFGIELEYMIVDRNTFDVKPITDKVLYDIAGEYLTEVECGRISYSNELALHVIELKTTQPEAELHGLDQEFHRHVARIDALLEPYGARLLPTAAHPWMDPFREMKLWTHEYNPIYEAYNRIFDCRGHGWANLQSMHLNLPFSGDEEFFRLHAAIRVLLPIMPALSASSPIMEGKVLPKLDSRLDVYRFNQKKIPKIAGDVIPEQMRSCAQYSKEILEPIYRDIAPYDPEKILQDEWLNSRGAIARFDRMAIEIRILDIQETPISDIAIAQAIVFVLKGLIGEKWTTFDKVFSFPQEPLVSLFHRVIADADETQIDDRSFLSLFGLDKPLTAKELWCHLLSDLLEKEKGSPLEVILNEGPLARRILRKVQDAPTKTQLHAVYSELADCLKEGKLFR
jgi:glutamate---cysteine ligase / carboxylate-amine ligase